MRRQLIEEKFILLNGRKVRALVPRLLSDKEREEAEKRLDKLLRKIVFRKMKQEALEIREKLRKIKRSDKKAKMLKRKLKEIGERLKKRDAQEILREL